jgi:hypothetical protein
MGHRRSEHRVQKKGGEPFELRADARNTLGQGLDLSRSALGVPRGLISLFAGSD